MVINMELLDEYISDNVLKSGLHKIRMNSNLIRHDEDYFEQYDDEKRLQYFKIIDAFTDYITMSKISKSYEVFSLVSRCDVFKKSLKLKEESIFALTGKVFTNIPIKL